MKHINITEGDVVQFAFIPDKFRTLQSNNADDIETTKGIVAEIENEEISINLRTDTRLALGYIPNNTLEEVEHCTLDLSTDTVKVDQPKTHKLTFLRTIEPEDIINEEERNEMGLHYNRYSEKETHQLISLAEQAITTITDRLGKEWLIAKDQIDLSVALKMHKFVDKEYPDKYSQITRNESLDDDTETIIFPNYKQAVLWSYVIRMQYSDGKWKDVHDKSITPIVSVDTSLSTLEKPDHISLDEDFTELFNKKWFIGMALYRLFITETAELSYSKDDLLETVEEMSTHLS